MAHGPHARTRRFFDDKFQMEELAPDDFEGIRMLLGHGVDETDIRNFRASPFRLMTVLRHPVDLTRSAYNHMRSVNARRGLEVDSEAFLKARPANFMTTFLLDRFPSFVDDPAAPREEQIVSLLRKFEYVLTTEKLGQQAGGLFEELGFDTAMEHRRVAGDKATLETTDADILARNPIDLMIFERANQRLRCATLAIGRTAASECTTFSAASVSSTTAWSLPSGSLLSSTSRRTAFAKPSSASVS